MSLSRIQFTDDTAFAYALGEIRAKEVKMIPKSEFERMSEMSIEQIKKSLIDFGYNESDNNIEEDRKKTLSLISHLINNVEKYKDFYRIYFLKNDIYNLKLYLKKKFQENNELDFKFIEGTLSEDDIIQISEKEKYDILSKSREDIKFVKNMFDTIKNNPVGEIIDVSLEKIYFYFLFKIIDKYRIQFLKYYFTEYIDLINIENLIRFKLLDKDVFSYKEIFYNYGNLKEIDIYTLYDMDIEKIPQKLFSKDYYKNIAKAVDEWINKGDFDRFSLEKDNYLMSILKKAKYHAFGIEPLIGYLEGKETEYKNIYILLNGKKEKIENNIIKELIRDTYV